MKSVLVAEGGASKIDWRLCQNGVIVASFRSAGFNPSAVRDEVILDLLQEGLAPLADVHVDDLYFYGAGLGTSTNQTRVLTCLQKYLPQTHIHLHHDLDAAVFATLRPKGIVCILGTGSHSAFYQNHQVVHQIGGQGYLFGDEGSGADLGKHFLKHLLQGDFGKYVVDAVVQHTGKTLLDLRTEIYQSPRPNVAMADLCPTLLRFSDDPSVHTLIVQRFTAFFETTVTRYINYCQYPLDVVGSIGVHFLPFLQEAAHNCDIHQLTSIQHPVDNLLKYHLEQC